MNKKVLFPVLVVFSLHDSLTTRVQVTSSLNALPLLALSVSQTSTVDNSQ